MDCPGKGYTSIIGPDGELVIAGEQDGYMCPFSCRDEAIENANLCVAAPDLLELAELILKEWSAPTEGVLRGELIARLSQYSHKARAAINKAKGI